MGVKLIWRCPNCGARLGCVTTIPVSLEIFFHPWKVEDCPICGRKAGKHSG